MKAPTEHFKVNAAWMRTVDLDPDEGQVFPIILCRGDNTLKVHYVTLQLPGRIWVVDTRRGQFVTVIKRQSPCLNIDTLVEGGRV